MTHKQFNLFCSASENNRVYIEGRPIRQQFWYEQKPINANGHNGFYSIGYRNDNP